jgi:nucleotide-binding universal stress UspA family protein
MQTSQTKAAKGSPLGFKRFLVPVDFSPHSRCVLRRAGQMAAEFGASIETLHVIEPIDFAKELKFITTTGDATKAETAAREKLVKFAAQEIGSELPVFPHVLVGKPFDRIVEFARKRRIDLIIMPTHGRTGLKHTLLGSTAERVVQYASCPVLVWRDCENKSGA